ncbi:MAG: small ribosomal subunit Rsm22 family protein [Bacteriovoracaceae bacterium]
MIEIKDCLPHLLYQFKSEQEIFDSIIEISKKFTTERENISDYLHDDRLVSAYTLYFLLTNIPKFRGILNWLPNDFVEQLKGATFIDVGAGPGTFSIAFREWTSQSGEVYQIETSKKMKEQARLLWDGLYQSNELIQELPKNGGGPRVMFFGHSANEMGPQTALDYIKRVNPDHIIFLEPGTKSFFKEMLEIRKVLLKENWNQVYPCSTHESCPMENTDNWCHQYLHHVHTPEIERVSQKVGINRRYMAMTLQVFSKNISYKTNSAKIIRVMPETKFSFEWEICDQNQLYDVQVMKRGMNKSDMKNISNFCAGDLITYEVDKDLGPNKKRIKLIL